MISLSCGLCLDGTHFSYVCVCLLCLQLRQLEMQLEQEYEEKQMVLHEKQDLEGLIGTLCDQVRGKHQQVFERTLPASRPCSERWAGGGRTVQKVFRKSQRPVGSASLHLLLQASSGPSIPAMSTLTVSSKETFWGPHTAAFLEGPGE